MTSTAAPERLRTPRIPRIDELTQNEIRTAQRKERDESYPKTLMQRLASAGLGRTEPNDARNSIDDDSLNIAAYLHRRLTP